MESLTGPGCAHECQYFPAFAIAQRQEYTETPPINPLGWQGTPWCPQTLADQALNSGGWGPGEGRGQRDFILSTFVPRADEAWLGLLPGAWVWRGFESEAVA